MPPKKIRKAVRLCDIAHKLQLSVSTVSMALAGHANINTDTIRRVQDCAAELGYAPPEKRKTSPDSQTKRIGFWVFGGELEQDSFAALVMALSQATTPAGVLLEMASFKTGTDALTQAARARELDGLLLCGIVNRSELEAIARLHDNVCLMGRWRLGPGEPALSPVPVVHWQEEEIGAAATRHLLSLGHRRIACLCAQLHPGMSQSRFCAGYRQALQSEGITQTWIGETSHLFNSGEAAAELLLADAPTAVVAPNAQLLALFLAACQRRGYALNSDASCVWDSTEQAQYYGLQQCAIVRTSARDLAAAALHVVTTPGVFPAGSSWAVPYYLQLGVAPATT